MQLVHHVVPQQQHLGFAHAQLAGLGRHLGSGQEMGVAHMPSLPAYQFPLTAMPGSYAAQCAVMQQQHKQQKWQLLMLLLVLLP